VTIAEVATGRLRFLGTIDAPTGMVRFLPNRRRRLFGPLPPPSRARDGYVIVERSGTLPEPRYLKGEPVKVGDWIVSARSAWHIIRVSDEDLTLEDLA
jgi:hypothetical protein